MHRTALRITGACAALLVNLTAFAGQVPVPLTIEARHLEREMGAALGMDADGRTELVRDACNRTELSDLELTTADGQLHASMHVAAHVGARVLDACVGPGRWEGRMRVLLVPAVDDSGLVVVLGPESVELRRPDGTTGLLTRPTRALAEGLILPRMRQARIDLRESLTALDQLLQGIAGADGIGLTDGSHLTGVAVADEALEATLAFTVTPRAGDPGPAPPLDPEELAQWQRVEDELDGFLTTVITHLARHAADHRDLRFELQGVLLDSRRAIAEALVENRTGEPDPVRRLFVDSWDRLRPQLAELERTGLVPEATGLRLAGFLAGGDAIRALDALGPEYGVEVTRDGLRRLARMLLADEAPAAFTPLPLDVEPGLRELFGLGGAGPSGAARDAVGPRLLGWLVADARAGSSRVAPAQALQGRVPRLAELAEYLELVAALLSEETNARLGGGMRVPDVFKPMIRPLVKATAWKESCWRHYTGSPDNPQVMRSSIGALGIMQIHARVWRGLYDLDRLADDVQYNVGAGIEILEYYLVDYALRRGEHEAPGGVDNLVRATYAAYNGGPSHLSRYRRDDTPARLRAIDNAFWRHYETIRREGRPEASSCYPVP